MGLVLDAFVHDEETHVAFRISSLPRALFDGVFQLDDDALAARGMKRYVADRKPGFPCRVSLRDAEPGERVILLPFIHVSGATPYQASGPIFVRELAEDVLLPADTVPDLLRTRPLSVRAYDLADFLVESDVVDGRSVEPVLTRMLANSRVSHLHVHFAKPGCYACRVDRA